MYSKYLYCDKNLLLIVNNFLKQLKYDSKTLIS